MVGPGFPGPTALLGPVGYKGFMQAVVGLALVVPHAVVMSHALSPFFSPVQSTGEILFCLGVSPLTISIIVYACYIFN